MLRSRIMPSFAYLECHCSLFRRVRYSLSVATLLSNSLCTRTLAIGSYKSDKRAHAAINTIMVNHYPSFPVILPDAKMFIVCIKLLV